MNTERRKTRIMSDGVIARPTRSSAPVARPEPRRRAPEPDIAPEPKKTPEPKTTTKHKNQPAQSNRKTFIAKIIVLLLVPVLVGYVVGGQGRQAVIDVYQASYTDTVRTAIDVSTTPARNVVHVMYADQSSDSQSLDSVIHAGYPAYIALASGSDAGGYHALLADVADLDRVIRRTLESRNQDPEYGYTIDITGITTVHLDSALWSSKPPAFSLPVTIDIRVSANIDTAAVSDQCQTVSTESIYDCLSRVPGIARAHVYNYPVWARSLPHSDSITVDVK